MGKKYRRYKNALEKYLSSDKGRRFFHMAYSIGAAVVVLGALFKINHYPLGGELMLIGLGTEALIFAISAFDKPVRDYPWEEVFPEFATLEQLEQKKYFEERNRLREKAGSSQTADNSIVSVEETTRAKVTTTYYPSSDSTSQEATTVSERSSISNEQRSDLKGNITVVAGGGYPTSDFQTGTIEAGTDAQTPISSGVSAPRTMGGGFSPDMASASEKYVSQVNQMSDNVEKFNELTQSLNTLSDVLISSFKNITDNSEGIGASTKGYVVQMENLNRNISGLNTIYEIQLKGVSSQIHAIDQINAGLERIKNLYDGSIVDSSVFRTETEKMAQQLKDLNAVYARMLQAMTVNMAMSGGMPGNISFGNNNNEPTK